jgi:hypothetical protein
MRLKDLNTTTEYAYRPGSKYGPVHKIRVQDASQLYRKSRYRRGEEQRVFPARPGQRANKGDFHTDQVGVLISYVDKPEVTPTLGLPTKILSTWEEYEISSAAEEKRAKQEQQDRAEAALMNERNATHISDLLKKHPEIRIYASPYDSKVSVPYPVLIRLLEALPVQADSDV